MDRNRFADPGDLKRCIFRSRRRTGRCEFSARLFLRRPCSWRADKPLVTDRLRSYGAAKAQLAIIAASPKPAKGVERCATKSFLLKEQATRAVGHRLFGVRADTADGLGDSHAIPLRQSTTVPKTSKTSA